ncbi:Similar to Endo-1,3(4)-beta-glucanase xgeA; acc. no. Q5BAP5 [Pyronema omphalodes CBS 100304]|uniref:Similar to Endo-1,3(4)-beta-glucanase xgeA acc. no. Q5BAP5 n=1 Tax=Pyronema omphalodes (strain CBS 100304) TaxID=1076935 RepID=U4LBP9_PYROM|nr:Similar to Endo-1,3(4)-beta-glucanase xgeA; acc. no. Q5BAP5 [Pyronema omphalodes CBS 100304]
MPTPITCTTGLTGETFTRYSSLKEAMYWRLYRRQEEETNNRKEQCVYLGVDHDNKLSTTDQGRRSIRVESKEKFNHDLFVLNVDHLPWGCGVWPALYVSLWCVR